MTTTTQAKYKQVNPDGSVIIYHFQTNADIVVNGTTKRVPTITEINGWASIKSEVETARNGKTSLDARLDEVDVKLQKENLLAAIKEVDGDGSGLDAHYLAGRSINDAGAASTIVLWTSDKINTELGKKVNNTEVVTTATANKILKLNSAGLLPTGVTGNAATATKLASAVTIKLGGDLVGEAQFDGSGNILIEGQVKNNSHEHSQLVNAGANSSDNTSTIGNIHEFKRQGEVKSVIDANGNFTGSAAKVGGKTVDDNGTTTNHLWSADKIIKNLETKMNTSVLNDNAISIDNIWSANKVAKSLGFKLDTSAIVTGPNSIEVNGMLIQWGIVDMVGKTSVITTFGKSYMTAPTITLSEEASDFTWICKRKPNATTKTQFELHCNKAIAAPNVAKISWIAIGEKERVAGV